MLKLLLKKYVEYDNPEHYQWLQRFNENVQLIYCIIYVLQNHPTIVKERNDGPTFGTISLRNVKFYNDMVEFKSCGDNDLGLNVILYLEEDDFHLAILENEYNIEKNRVYMLNDFD